MKTISVIWFVLIGAFANKLPQQETVLTFNTINAFQKVGNKMVQVGNETGEVYIEKSLYSIRIKHANKEAETVLLITEKVDDGVYLTENIHGIKWLVMYLVEDGEDVVQVTNGKVGFQLLNE
jgi:hypothetical protein